MNTKNLDCNYIFLQNFNKIVANFLHKWYNIFETYLLKKKVVYMELKLTNEEIKAIKYYKDEAYKEINRFLNSDSRIEIAKLCEENEEVSVNYNRVSVVNYIDTIKNVYSAILKSYLSRGIKENWRITR